MAHATVEELKAGIESDDAAAVSNLLTQDGSIRKRLDEDLHTCNKPFLAACRSPEMVEVLLQHGASVAKVGEWWTPGFGTEGVLPAIGDYLIQRGATITPHALAGLGLVERLRTLLDEQPDQVNAKGGDGCRPLHFARTVEIARLLLECGADRDARDDDHHSTPAQWRIAGAPEVSRFLVADGANPDIFMAAALGDLNLAGLVIKKDPLCTTYCIGNNNGPFPGIGFQGKGGTIYQWTLGFNQTPHEIALKRGHREVFDLLMEHTPPKNQLLVACMIADRSQAESISREHPDLLEKMDSEDRALLAKLCWETNQNIDAVRLMLDLGFPVDVPEGNHGYSPLHNAAWCGNAELMELLIERGHPVDVKDPQYGATPIGWACHSCLEAKRHPHGEFARVVDLLLQAGATYDKKYFPTGHEGIDAVLKRHLGN
jgi:ankyrin repeat protein